MKYIQVTGAFPFSPQIKRKNKNIDVDAVVEKANHVPNTQQKTKPTSKRNNTMEKYIKWDDLKKYVKMRTFQHMVERICYQIACCINQKNKTECIKKKKTT